MVHGAEAVTKLLWVIVAHMSMGQPDWRDPRVFATLDECTAALSRTTLAWGSLYWDGSAGRSGPWATEALVLPAKGLTELKHEGEVVEYGCRRVEFEEKK